MRPPTGKCTEQFLHLYSEKSRWTRERKLRMKTWICFFLFPLCKSGAHSKYFSSKVKRILSSSSMEATRIPLFFLKEGSQSTSYYIVNRKIPSHPPSCSSLLLGTHFESLLEIPPLGTCSWSHHGEETLSIIRSWDFSKQKIIEENTDQILNLSLQSLCPQIAMAGVGGRSVLAPKFKTVLVHGPYSVMNKRARPEHDWKICMAKLWDWNYGCTYCTYEPTKIRSIRITITLSM